LVWIEIVEPDGKVIKSDIKRVNVNEGWFGSLSAKVNQALGYVTWQRLSFFVLAIIAVLGWYKYFVLIRMVSIPKQPESLANFKPRKTRSKKSE